MIRIVCPILFLWIMVFTVPHVHSQELAAQWVRAKNATVFIRTEMGEGSGFLFERNMQTGHLATAAHVVDRISNDQPIKVYFLGGTENQFSVNATIIGIDTLRDIAFLRVHAPYLPEPIYFNPNARIIETLPVMIAGYPFGGLTATLGTVPSITLSRGAISSIKKSVGNTTTVLQFDANVNPGNSGGPVLNDQGEVIGIVSSKIDGTQLGFAVPISMVLRDWKGNWNEIRTTSIHAEVNQERYQIQGTLIDPLHSISAVKIRLAAASSLNSITVESKWELPMTPAIQEISCIKFGDTFQAEIVLPIEKVASSDLVAQIEVVRSEGTSTVSFPIPYSLWPNLTLSRSKGTLPDKPPSSEKSPSPETPPSTEASKWLVRDVEATGLISERAERLAPSSKLSALTAPMHRDNVEIRRVLTPNARFFSSIEWSPSGDSLWMSGSSLLRIDYPDAQRIEIHPLAKDALADGFTEQGLFLRGKGFGCIVDSESCKPIKLFQTTLPTTFLVSPNREGLFATPSSDSFQQLWPLDVKTGLSLVPWNVTNQGKTDFAKRMILTIDGKHLLSVTEDRIARFLVDENGLQFEDSASLVANMQWMDGDQTSRGSTVAFVNHSSIESETQSRIVLYPVQSLDKKVELNIQDKVTCYCVDEVRDRVYFAGHQGLWVWHSETKRPTRVPLPASLPTIQRLAMHPKANLLAIHCQTSLSESRLYWTTVP